MAICSFCDEVLAKGTGVMYVKRDGTLFYFCSGKCRKNLLNLGREGRRQKWTKSFRIFRGKEKLIKDAKKEAKTEAKAETKITKAG